MKIRMKPMPCTNSLSLQIETRIKGWMNWTQVFGLDMKKLIKRVNDNDDFSPIAPADWNMHTVSEN